MLMSTNEELPPYFLLRSWFVLFFFISRNEAKSVPEIPPSALFLNLVPKLYCGRGFSRIIASVIMHAHRRL